jgi:hypothetical protein
MAMDDTEFDRIINQATDHFRLETLPEYLVPQEDEDFTAWKRGERRRRTPETSEWLAEIRDSTAAGRRWWRVRVLDYPLTEYSAHELHAYQDNAAAGEEIYVVDRAWNAELANLHEDFWIFDSTVVRMLYDEQGHYLGAERGEDLQHYLDIRDRALRHAIPLADYMRKHEPDLIADPL